MTFGIDTETNNASGSQSVLTVVGTTGLAGQVPGTFTTVFNGSTLTESFLDTGSNGLYFNDGSVATCTELLSRLSIARPAPRSFTATLDGQNGVSASVTFSVAAADTLGADRRESGGVFQPGGHVSR
jgi:hypothetical protein